MKLLEADKLAITLSPDQLVFLGTLDIVVGYCAWPAAIVTIAILAKRVLDGLEPVQPTQPIVKPRSIQGGTS